MSATRIPLRRHDDERGWCTELMRGSAHGALTDCLFLYDVTDEYDPGDPDEHGIPWNDPRVEHLWSTRSPVLSRDKTS